MNQNECSQDNTSMNQEQVYTCTVCNAKVKRLNEHLNSTHDIKAPRGHEAKGYAQRRMMFLTAKKPAKRWTNAFEEAFLAHEENPMHPMVNENAVEENAVEANAANNVAANDEEVHIADEDDDDADMEVRIRVEFVGGWTPFKCQDNTDNSPCSRLRTKGWCKRHVLTMSGEVDIDVDSTCAPRMESAPLSS